MGSDKPRDLEDVRELIAKILMLANITQQEVNLELQGSVTLSEIGIGINYSVGACNGCTGCGGCEGCSGCSHTLSSTGINPGDTVSNPPLTTARVQSILDAATKSS